MQMAAPIPIARELETSAQRTMAIFSPKNGTIILPIKSETLALSSQATLGIEGKEFSRKPEHHLTLVGFKTGREIIKLSKTDTTLLGRISTLVAETNFDVSPQDDLFHLKKDKPGVKPGEVIKAESVIQMLQSSRAEAFYTELSRITGLAIIPPHYT